jgi:glutathione S-transferase
MLKLYGGARSRASIVQWYLEELDVPYEYVLLDMQAGQHKEPEFLEINPFAKVPAIEEDGYRLWESGAILLYLSEKYDPSLTTPQQRATIAQWVVFANATLGPGVFVEATRDREMPRLLAPLNQILDRQPFLLGDQFSAADVAVGSMLAYMPLMLKIGFDDYPAVADYLKRIGERPAFQKTIGGRKAA